MLGRHQYFAKLDMYQKAIRLESPFVNLDQNVEDIFAAWDYCHCIIFANPHLQMMLELPNMHL
jgi:hypothetical protein